MRHHPKTDSNQAEIVRGLRGLGYGVLILAAIGGGCPDLLAASGTSQVLLEVKNTEGRGTALTPAETRWIASWPGSVAIVTSLGEAVEALGGTIL